MHWLLLDPRGMPVVFFGGVISFSTLYPRIWVSWVLKVKILYTSMITHSQFGCERRSMYSCTHRLCACSNPASSVELWCKFGSSTSWRASISTSGKVDIELIVLLLVSSFSSNWHLAQQGHCICLHRQDMFLSMLVIRRYRHDRLYVICVTRPGPVSKWWGIQSSPRSPRKHYLIARVKHELT